MAIPHKLLDDKEVLVDLSHDAGVFADASADGNVVDAAVVILQAAVG